MLSSSIHPSTDRHPECLAEESAAVMEQPAYSPTRDPGRQRAADRCSGPDTVYHVMKVSAYSDVRTSLDGGGLYARCAGQVSPLLRNVGTAATAE